MPALFDCWVMERAIYNLVKMAKFGSHIILVRVLHYLMNLLTTPQMTHLSYLLLNQKKR